MLQDSPQPNKDVAHIYTWNHPLLSVRLEDKNI